MEIRRLRLQVEHRVAVPGAVRLLASGPQSLACAREIPLHENLLTLPSIGRILELTITMEVGDTRRFPTDGDFASRQQIPGLGAYRSGQLCPALRRALPALAWPQHTLSLLAHRDHLFEVKHGPFRVLGGREAIHAHARSRSPLHPVGVVLEVAIDLVGTVGDGVHMRQPRIGIRLKAVSALSRPPEGRRRAWGPVAPPRTHTRRFFNGIQVEITIGLVSSAPAPDRTARVRQCRQRDRTRNLLEVLAGRIGRGKAAHRSTSTQQRLRRVDRARRGVGNLVAPDEVTATSGSESPVAAISASAKFAVAQFEIR